MNQRLSAIVQPHHFGFLLMELNELIGSELLECRFGRVWVRLVFAKRHQGTSELQYCIDTDNHVSDRLLLRHGNNPEAVMRSVSAAVYPSVEQRLSQITRTPDGVRFDFESGSVIFICYDGDSIDNLFKLTNRQTGEWSMQD